MLQKPADFLLRLISKPLRSKIMSLFESHRQITHRVIPQSKHRGYIKVKTCRQSVVNKVPTILTYNNHDILLKKTNQLLLLARKYNFYIVARWAVLSLKPATECVRGNSSVSNRNQNFSENSLTSQISQSILIG